MHKKYAERISPFFVTQGQFEFVHKVREDMEVSFTREVNISEALRAIIDGYGAVYKDNEG